MFVIFLEVYWLGRLNASCEDDGGEQVIDRYECELAMKEIIRRYIYTKDKLFSNPEPFNPSGCVTRCNWMDEKGNECHNKRTPKLVFYWKQSHLLFGPGDKWRFVCKAPGQQLCQIFHFPFL